MKTALILLATGFEETEAVTIIDVLRRAHVEITSASLDDLLVEGAHAIKIMADNALVDVQEQIFDAIILPGGMGGTNNLLASEDVRALLEKHSAQGSIVSAICAAPLVLEKAGLLAGKRATIFPGLEDKLVSSVQVTGDIVVSDGEIITSKGPGTAMEFALHLVEKLAGRMMADQVADGLLFSRNRS